ncbi:MAG: MFS transporter [Spirochaetaceae bacterium]|nr:MFS transporter [Spirochaetaceae bacterium]
MGEQNWTGWKRNTALFLGGQAVSLSGSMLVQYAITWYITLKTQSGALRTLFIIAGFLPMFFISPFAGVWADRYNRKYLIVIADGAIALATLCAAVLFSLGLDSMWFLGAAVVVRAVGQGVQSPAVSAMLPQLVPPDSLRRVNAINGGIQSATMLLCPMISGALLNFASIYTIFYIDVLTAALGIGILLFCVKVSCIYNSDTERKRYFHELREGFGYVRHHGFILRLIVVSTVFFIAGSPIMFLTPLQVTRDFGAEVWRLTAIEVAFSVGMMAGNVAISVWGGLKNHVFSMALACVLFGFESIALGLLDNFWIYLGVMAITGCTVPLYNTPSAVLLQTKVDALYMGRVFSVFSMISSLMLPAGMLLFGPLADVVPISWLLIASGVVIALLCLPLAGSRTMREAGRAP